MPDPLPKTETPQPPQTSAPAPATKATQKSAQQIDYGNVPLSEEMDKAKWTLPPAQIVVVGVVIVLIVGFIVGWIFRYQPAASGQVRDVFAVETSDHASVLSTVLVSVRNDNEKSIFIKNMKGTLTTADGKTYDDTPASEVDYERYFQAFPDLRSHAIAALRPETKMLPGQQASGTLVFGFPVTKAQFDSRKNLEITVEPYDRRAIVISEKPQK
jgi:hypothetical protein